MVSNVQVDVDVDNDTPL